ncbi:MAG: carbamoyltransferase HypF [Desulfovibrionaceae bacterium]|nr:carbamoyltransferase HypF [Desulfovibrionaceae bacterium]
MQRLKISVSGQVQGVGFRPFVFRTAGECGLSGHVRNTGSGVEIEVQGKISALEQFKVCLRSRLPPLARIDTFFSEEIALLPEENGFVILSSCSNGSPSVLISPDTAICADCLSDIRNPDNRRFGYPFTNCTNCGPRYSIISSLPYDRPGTAMACFPMCPECLAEYNDPADRRFHAQPNACPVCGPEIRLLNRSGEEIARGNEALIVLARALASGKIAAIKGLGGFHLACNALMPEAAATLRQRKQRPAKPLAIMVANLEAAVQTVRLDEHEVAALTSPQAPIVLCRKRENCPLPDEVAPGLNRVGIMLPYTPLHYLLLEYFSSAVRENAERNGEPVMPAALVMTSGNLSDEPIVAGNWQALRELSGVADMFLLHNRDILVRADDSVLRVDNGATQFIRRARGYAPQPLDFEICRPPFQACLIARSCVMGVGAELKNTICFARPAGPPNRGETYGFVSQHIGDITHPAAENFMRELAEHLCKVYSFKPDAIVRDLHPDYLSSRFAHELGEEKGIPVLKLQHHFAHAFSVLFENQHQGEGLVLALDGSGLGTDGTIWGGELIKADTMSGEAGRLGHIARTLTPGGDAAARQPWRMAQAYLHELGQKGAWFEEKFAEESQLIEQMLRNRLNCPINSSLGRLFDAVAGLLGFGAPNNIIRGTAGGVMSFEGQAAMWLESIQDFSDKNVYPCPLAETDGSIRLDTLELFNAVYKDVRRGVDPGAVSRRFHLGMAHGLCAMADAGAQAAGVSVIGLSGGVMHNAALSELLPQLLKRAKLTPLVHRRLPPGDGCISFGQAAWGMIQSA